MSGQNGHQALAPVRLSAPAPGYTPQDAWTALHDDFFRSGLAKPRADARRAMARAYRTFAQRYPSLGALALDEASRCEREAAAMEESRDEEMA